MNETISEFKSQNEVSRLNFVARPNDSFDPIDVLGNSRVKAGNAGAAEGTCRDDTDCVVALI